MPSFHHHFTIESKAKHWPNPPFLPSKNGSFSFPSFAKRLEIVGTGIGFANTTVSCSSIEVAQITVETRIESTAQIALDESDIIVSISEDGLLLVNASFVENLMDIGVYAEIHITFPASYSIESFYMDANLASLLWTQEAPLVDSSFDAAIRTGGLRVASPLQTEIIGIAIGDGSASFTSVSASESVLIGVENGAVQGTFNGFASFYAKCVTGGVDVVLEGEKEEVLIGLDVATGPIRAKVDQFRGSYSTSVLVGRANVHGADFGSTPEAGTVGGVSGKGILEASVTTGFIDLTFV
ncbi:hypothetical protein BCR33DRAFT_716132 [Rhizoclosmatium globosum]|uniref:Adhesin domain-containing protein n=1 Tax=Rhizoclosmatium globosum TaxID=329046 RepID=A0A1Y2CGT4_9FUNG|nr:hypothetical protein BCR33DRAFT_716132 [Rhizoclosmatium globosum]|eukprot:ORY46136.1 hypothetical protein BCR33DRAFT_716132 [Rhizoclosmatium globosum]